MRWYCWSPEKVAGMAELAEQGLTRQQAALKMGITYDALRHAAKAYGIQFPRAVRTGGSWFKWTPKKVNTVRRMVKAGHTAQEIAKTIGTTRNAVIGKADRMGFKWPPRGAAAVRRMEEAEALERKRKAAKIRNDQERVRLAAWRARHSGGCITENCGHTPQPGRDKCANCIREGLQNRPRNNGSESLGGVNGGSSLNW